MLLGQLSHIKCVHEWEGIDTLCLVPGLGELHLNMSTFPERQKNPNPTRQKDLMLGEHQKDHMII